MATQKKYNLSSQYSIQVRRLNKAIKSVVLDEDVSNIVIQKYESSITIKFIKKDGKSGIITLNGELS